MELTGSDYGRQAWVVVYHLPNLVIDAVGIHQFVLQMRAHIGCVNVGCVHNSNIVITAFIYGRILSVFTVEIVDSRAYKIIVVGFGMFKEAQVLFLSITNYYDSNRAYACPLEVGCLAAESCKVFHSFFYAYKVAVGGSIRCPISIYFPNYIVSLHH